MVQGACRQNAPFPTYVALLLDKLFVGFVKSAENYTNQCAVKDGLVINLDMVDLSRAIGTFYNIVKEIKKHVDYDKLWVDYPAFLSLPPDATPDGSNKRIKLPPPLTLPPPLLGATVQVAGAALAAATATSAVVVAAAQAVVVVSTHLLRQAARVALLGLSAAVHDCSSRIT